MFFPRHAFAESYIFHFDHYLGRWRDFEAHRLENRDLNADLSDQEDEDSSGALRLASGEEVSCAPCSNCPRLLPNSLKVTVVVTSYISQYPGMAAARLATNNTVLREFFAVGEVGAWGSMYAVTGMYVIDSIFIDQSNSPSSTIGKVKNVAYWLGVSVLSAGAQIPDAYVSYTYTGGNLFWSAFVVCVYSSFTMNSIDAATQKIVRTNNFISRFIYRNTNKCRIFQSRENFCELANNYFISFLRESDSPHKNLFFKILNDEQAETSESKALLYMICKGLDRRMLEISKQNIYIERTGKGIELTGAIVFLARYYLEGRLAYQSAKLILDDNYFAAFLIFLTLTPNVYLGITNASSTLGNGCLQVMRFIHACRNGTWQEYLNKKTISTAIGYTFATALSVFGLGSTLTLVRDEVDFEGDETLKAIIITFTALLAINTTTTLYDIVSNYISTKMAQGDEKVMLEIEGKVSEIVDRIERMEAEEFEFLISDLEQSIGSDFSLLDDLATSDQFDALRNRLLDLPILSEFEPKTVTL